MTTPLHSSISNLIEIDQQEAALKEQLQQLTRRKEEAKKNEGERAREQLYEQIPAARVHLLGLLRTAQNLGIEIEGEYVTTLHRIVKEAGASGIALSLVQEVLPDAKNLQFAREELGPKGSDEIVELTAKEHLKEGKGRGIYFVWNDKPSTVAPVTTGSSDSGGDQTGDASESDGAEETAEDTKSQPPPEGTKPAKKPAK